MYIKIIHTLILRTIHISILVTIPYSLNVLDKYPFVVDVPKQAWDKLRHNQKVDFLKRDYLNPVRAYYIEKSIGVIQSTNGVQLSVYRRLDYPHGHRVIPMNSTAEDEFIELVQPTTCIERDKMVSQMIIQQEDAQLLPLFQKILERLKTRYKGKLHAQSYVERQRLFFDSGVNSGPSQSRFQGRGEAKECANPLGIAVPLNNVVYGMDTLVDGIFQIFSKLLNKYVPWLWEKRSKERIREFSNSMVTGNIIEANRCCAYPFYREEVMFTRSFLCHDHMDEKNDPSHPGVAVFSKMIWENDDLRGIKGWRVAVICYSRKSIGDYYNRLRIKYGPAVQFCLTVFDEFPNWRKHIDELMSKLVDFQDNITHRLMKCGSRYASYKTFECHCDPVVYLSSVVDCVALLQMKYHLDYVEVVSILRAFAALPHAVYYFVLVTSMICNRIEKYDRMINKNRGVLVGYHFWKLMEKAYLSDIESKNSKPTRFPLYTPQKEKSPFEPASWRKEVREMCFYMKNSWKSVDKLKSKNGKNQEYGKLFNNTKWKFAKVLIMNHVLGIASILGLIPFEFVTCYEKASESSGLKFLKDQHRIPAGKENMERFLDSFCASLKHQHNYYANRRISENIGCKIGRQLGRKKNNRKRAFVDYYFEGQNVYRVCFSDEKKLQLHITYSNGNERHTAISEEPLFNHWIYNTEWLTPQQFVFENGEMLGSLEEYELPKKFCWFNISWDYDAEKYFVY